MTKIFFVLIAAIMLWTAVLGWRATLRMEREREAKRKKLIEDLESGRRSWMSVGFTELWDGK